MDLSGRVALVTGSGQGIGRAIALKLAEVGATVVVNDMSEAVETVANEIRALNRESLAVLADVSSSEDVAKLLEAVISAYGKIDILVNNAGITRDHLVLRMSDDDWDRVISVDLKSVFLCTRAALRYMIKQRWAGLSAWPVLLASLVTRGRPTMPRPRRALLVLPGVSPKRWLPGVSPPTPLHPASSIL